MSWLYSQALVEEYSEGISLDGAQSALWNGTPTQPPSWCNDRTMAACRLSRSGMTFKPLADDHGEAVLMSCLEASPAKTSAPPEREQESTERDPVCGDTWQELLVKYDPDSSSWRTAHCLWDEDLPESSVTLPCWGMMRGGECWERTMPEHLIREIESGSWATPTATETGEDPEKLVKRMKERYGREMSHSNMKLSTQVKMWPTPTAAEGSKIPSQANYGQKGLSNHPEIVGKPTRPKKNKSRKGKRQFPTPTARDHHGAYRTNALIRKDGKSRAFDLLPNAVLDGKGAETCSGGQLNPTWVESYLMGWVIAWTSMEPLPRKVFQEWEKTFLTE